MSEADIADRDRRAVAYEAAITAGRIKDLVRAARIPKLHQLRRAFLTNEPAWVSIKDKTLESIGKECGCLIALIGNRGSGKTQIAVEAIYAACDAERAGLYCTAMEFFLALRASYHKDSDETEQSVMARYFKPKLLVIDETQERAETPFEDRSLVALIDWRYRECLDTILISNQTPAEFAKSMGASIVDRAREHGLVFEFKGKSFRVKS